MTIYTKTARFDEAKALSEVDLRTLAPSIFTAQAHPDRSDRFRPICTWDAVQALMKEGFSVVGAQQSTVRQADRTPFSKHLLRLRRLDETKTWNVGQVVPEMLLKNANDGSSVYDLFSALFRIACMNSLVSLVSPLSSCKVRHTGDVVSKVVEGTFTVIDESVKALAAPEAWSDVHLIREERQALAEAAHAVRWPVDEEGKPTTAVEPVQLLNVRRAEDNKSDLWTTFNVVQENVMRGGLANRTVQANGTFRRSRSRQIKGVDQSVALNRALFTLANRMAEIKGVKIAA